MSRGGHRATERCCRAPPLHTPQVSLRAYCCQLGLGPAARRRGLLGARAPRLLLLRCGPAPRPRRRSLSSARSRPRRPPQRVDPWRIGYPRPSAQSLGALGTELSAPRRRSLAPLGTPAPDCTMRFMRAWADKSMKASSESPTDCSSVSAMVGLPYSSGDTHQYNYI